jgi:hypothetical protein
MAAEEAQEERTVEGKAPSTDEALPSPEALEDAC